jgi:hypothetical protein
VNGVSPDPSGITDEMVEMAARRMAARHLADEHPQAFDTDNDKAEREYWLDLARVALEHVLAGRMAIDDPREVCTCGCGHTLDRDWDANTEPARDDHDRQGSGVAGGDTR